MTLYSGACVLVDTNTSTGIHYIEMVTLYSGVIVLVEILILIPVYSWYPVLLLIVHQAPPDKIGDIMITFGLRRQRECRSQYVHRLGDSYQGWVPE